MTEPTQTQTRGLAARIGRWSAGHRKTAIFGWLAFVVAALAIGGTIGTKELSYAESFDGESRAAEQALADSDLESRASEVVLLQREVSSGEAGALAEAIADTSRRLERLDLVTSLQRPAARRGTISADGRSALIGFDVAGAPETAPERIEPALAAVERADGAHPAVAIDEVGAASGEKAFEESAGKDFQRAELFSIPLTLGLLLLAFGSLVAASVPVVLALSAVTAAIGLLALPSQLVGIDDAANSIVLLIGLAVGVDYSLFYLRREREERAAGRDAPGALDAAAATSGRAVLISGMTVLAAMAGMLLTGSDIFLSMGVGTMIVVAVAMAGSVTVLPALLAWLGDRVERGRLPFVGRRRRRGRSAVWGRLVAAVMRRPKAAAALAAGALVLLAVPAFSMETKLTGNDDLPAGLEEVRTLDRVEAAFPAEGSVAVVAVQAADVTAGPVRAAIADLREGAVAGGSATEPTAVEVAPDRSVARVELPLAGGESDAEAGRSLERLREQVIPATVGDLARVDVTGPAAATADFTDLMSSRAPLVVAFVLGLAFVLLLVSFRSVVIPLKAIVLNLLSVGAAYGVLVVVFQWGWGEGLLGFESNGAIGSWLPLFLFVVLFGLSMDYHVFILSRIREAVDRGLSTERAVPEAIESTAGVVTSAAAVMIAVFSVFATLGQIDLKQMGVGLSVAVLIDATIVRGVLLPATMRLLGEWNWYLPRWLEWLPRLRREPAGPSSAAAPVEGAAASGARSPLGEPVGEAAGGLRMAQRTIR